MQVSSPPLTKEKKKGGITCRELSGRESARCVTVINRFASAEDIQTRALIIPVHTRMRAHICARASSELRARARARVCGREGGIAGGGGSGGGQTAGNKPARFSASCISFEDAED